MEQDTPATTSGMDVRLTKDGPAWLLAGHVDVPVALVLDATIGWDAKGAFGWLSLAADTPGATVTAAAVAAAGPRGRDHAQEMVRELERHGWITRYRRPAEPGGLPVLVYELHPAAVPVGERTFRPSTARPRPGRGADVSGGPAVRGAR